MGGTFDELENTNLHWTIPNTLATFEIEGLVCWFVFYIYYNNNNKNK